MRHCFCFVPVLGPEPLTTMLHKSISSLRWKLKQARILLNSESQFHLKLKYEANPDGGSVMAKAN